MSILVFEKYWDEIPKQDRPTINGTIFIVKEKSKLNEYNVVYMIKNNSKKLCGSFIDIFKAKEFAISYSKRLDEDKKSEKIR